MLEVRLIDANALMEKVCWNCHGNDCVPDATDTVYGCMVSEIINQMPTIESGIDRAAILRLCNEIEMIIVTVCDTGYTLQDCDVEAVTKRTKAIRKELTGDAGTDD